MCTYLFALSDYEDTQNSKICIITAGSDVDNEEQRAETAKRNTDIFKGIISDVVKHSPNCTLIVVTPPGNIVPIYICQ